MSLTPAFPRNIAVFFLVLHPTKVNQILLNFQQLIRMNFLLCHFCVIIAREMQKNTFHLSLPRLRRNI